MVASSVVVETRRCVACVVDIAVGSVAGGILCLSGTGVEAGTAADDYCCEGVSTMVLELEIGLKGRGGDCGATMESGQGAGWVRERLYCGGVLTD